LLARWAAQRLISDAFSRMIFRKLGVPMIAGRPQLRHRLDLLFGLARARREHRAAQGMCARFHHRTAPGTKW
jgi:hypothetical protein